MHPPASAAPFQELHHQRSISPASPPPRQFRLFVQLKNSGFSLTAVHDWQSFGPSSGRYLLQAPFAPGLRQDLNS